MRWRVGRVIGKWNDNRHRAERRADESRVWRAIDRAASRLYVAGER